MTDTHPGHETFQIEYNRFFKMVLVGDPESGKTSLARRYLHDQEPADYVSTVGVVFGAKIEDLDDEKIKIQVWDTAGYEQYTTIAQALYRNARAVIVTFDLGNVESFHNARIHLDKLLRHRSNLENVAILLAGTKADTDQHVNDQQVETFRATWNEAHPNAQIFAYIKTSAMTENDNVSHLFTEAATWVPRTMNEPLVPLTIDGLKTMFDDAFTDRIARDRSRWCGLYGLFANSRIEGRLDQMSLQQIIAHAQRTHNRSREICIKLGWLDRHGRFCGDTPRQLIELCATPSPVVITPG